jgi:hypothetical protein
VEHAQGETALNTGDLILVKFHGVDLAAPIFIILPIGTKDARQQNTGASSEGMDRLGINCLSFIIYYLSFISFWSLYLITA